MGATAARPDRSPRNSSSWPWPPDVYPLLAYVALTAALTWPLARRLGSVVPRDLGDPLFSTWALWWNATVLPFSPAWWHAPIFAPVGNTMAMADHRVGFGLVTTPLILAGASPLFAYGVAFLATFVLSAGGAYALCRELGTSRPAAFVGGLAFGFHPFRAAHLEHLELLAAYGLPAALLCLHAWRRGGRAAWLVAAAAAVLLQGLTSGYYFAYGLVLLGGWVLWFARNLPARPLAALLAAIAAPAALLAPVFWRYRQVHADLGLARSVTETEALSADLTGFLSPPEMLAVWNIGGWATTPEVAVFPGVTAILLVVAAWWLAPPARFAPARLEPLWRWSARLAVLPVMLGVAAVAVAPLRLGVEGLELSVSNLYKPLSLATVLALPYALTRPRLRQAWATRSPLAFYALATLALWTLALGPTARAAGARVLYKAPYAWLMALPGFGDAFRAPARFAMLAALTLAVAAALALSRLSARTAPRAGAALGVLAAAGVLADGWIEPLPLPAPPPQIAALASLPPDTTILELPVGTYADLAAMSRAMAHRRRLANGYSGYLPPHYLVLESALEDGDVEALVPLATGRELTIVLPEGDHGEALGAAIAQRVGGARRGQAAGRELVVIPPAPPAATPAAAAGASLPFAATASAGRATLAHLRDGDRRTVWTTGAPQAGGEWLALDLGAARRVEGIGLSLGPYALTYPRQLRIETSADGAAWRLAWEGRTAAAVLEAALDAPATVPWRADVPPTTARFVRLMQLAAAAQPWAVAELAVIGPPTAR